ncbi:MAG: glycosyl hydrolase family 18 protein, partial [Oscillospiraceae bacterium]
TVNKGDTVYSLAKRFNANTEQIIADNGLSATAELVVGQALVIIPSATTHTVVKGDSLYAIAKMHETTVFDILAANPQITNPSNLQIGEILAVPVGENVFGNIQINGYAFPTITAETLENVLPSLTYLSIFSYQVHSDGTLLSLNEENIIAQAKRYRTAPMMVISNIKEGGSFESEIAHNILADNTTQGILIENIVQTLKQKGYYGVDIDFEYIYPQDKENYNLFLQRLTRRLHPLGYAVATALAPKTNANQRGLLYEAHDYIAHGELVDHVIIMTYEWGYTYGEPMAVAPINQVERVIKYAVSVIPSEKILMGIPNYGYDWILPYQTGTAAKTISNSEAVRLAQKVGAEIKYDTAAQSPYFNYYDSNGKEHIVWFEDARSIDAKLRLVKKYNLSGISYWTVNRYFPQGFAVQNALFNTEKLL